MDDSAKQEIVDYRSGRQKCAHHNASGLAVDCQMCLIELIDRLLASAQTAAIACAAAVKCRFCAQGIPTESYSLGGLGPALRHRIKQGAYDGKSDLMEGCASADVLSLSPESIERWRKGIEVEARKQEAKWWFLSIYGKYLNYQKVLANPSGFNTEVVVRANHIAALETEAAALKGEK